MQEQEKQEETCWEASYNSIAKLGFAICLLVGTYYIPCSNESLSTMTIKDLFHFVVGLSLFNFGLYGLAREGQNFFINIYQKENNESNKN